MTQTQRATEARFSGEWKRAGLRERARLRQRGSLVCKLKSQNTNERRNGLQVEMQTHLTYRHTHAHTNTHVCTHILILILTHVRHTCAIIHTHTQARPGFKGKAEKETDLGT